MKKATILSWALALVLLALGATALTQTPVKLVQSDDSIQAFWEKFRAAVIRTDKDAVAALSRFPIGMPYGMPTVKNKTQLIRRYRDVFNREANAAKCFSQAQPEIDKAKPKEFTVACKNSAGDEVIIYSFERAKNGWRFTGLDNINE